jgi:hypothetical protein
LSVRYTDPLGLDEAGARAAYGETASIYPQLNNAEDSIYTGPWNEQSSADLETARAFIADVSERNNNVHRAGPPAGNNPIEQRAWNQCVAAAEHAESFDLEDVDHFFIRQDGVGDQRPGYVPEGTNPDITFGPFVNEGGGDAPRGPNTYIDFYRGVR